MRGHKRKSQLLTFTILSNDANKVVKRFQIPKIRVILYACIASVPILLLVYFVAVGMYQQMESEQLTNTLELQTTKAEELQAKVDSMAEEKAFVEEKFEELNEIESELQEYITTLPEEASGGTSIPIDETDIEQNSDGTGFSILDSTKWIESYKDTLSTIEDTNQRLQYLPTAWPTDPDTITSHFGIRNDPFNANTSMHTGTDFGAPTGTNVYAGAEGKVIKAESYGGYGNAVIIQHSEVYQTLYAHLSELKVTSGDIVKKGQLVGLIGSTGRSTGPHLHYEIIKNDVPINPEEYLNNFSNYND